MVGGVLGRGHAHACGSRLSERVQVLAINLECDVPFFLSIAMFGLEDRN